MIVPMKKVSLIILSSQKTAALKKLRKLGLIHIEITEGSGERLNELKSQISLLENAIFYTEKKKNAHTKDVSTTEALAAARDIASLAEQKKAYISEQIALKTELDRLKAWGDIDPKEIGLLTKKGIGILLCEMPKSEYDDLDNRIKTLRLSETKSTVKFLIIKSGTEDENDAIEPLKQYLTELPPLSTAQMRQKIDDADIQIKAIDEKINSYSEYAKSIKNAVKAVEKEIQFEIYATGMANASLSSDGNEDISVAYFSGYIEAENLDKLRQTAKDNSWGIVAEEPCETDNVPTKLKNNKFVSLIYPLTDFLGTVPGYFEYDISAWFLLFILIFFGIIFGDGGYGLLVCAAAAIPIAKSLICKKKVSPAFILVGLFGISTVLWGTLTCTWFGLAPEQLPPWLRQMSIPVISNVYADKIWSLPWTQDGTGLTTSQNLQIFCFTLALVQLTIAHVKGAVRNKKTVKMLGDIGSILQLIGIYYFVLSLVVNGEVFSLGLIINGIQIGKAAIILIAIGFCLSFVFSNYEGSIMKSILASLTNIVSVLLGVVNMFSDIVSYIRLWAVGLAGAAISATVNDLAGPLLGNFMFMILAIILLVFGHGLNMILNTLSVIVHGIRLNTLEFSSHLNMSWSGHKFRPFAE